MASLTKPMILVGLLGVVACYFAPTLVDYPDDLKERIKEESLKTTPTGEEFSSQQEEEFDKMFKTAPTEWLWYSMGIYGGVAVWGMLGFLFRAPERKIRADFSLHAHAESGVRSESRGSGASDKEDLPRLGPPPA